MTASNDSAPSTQLTTTDSQPRPLIQVSVCSTATTTPPATRYVRRWVGVPPRTSRSSGGTSAPRPTRSSAPSTTSASTSSCSTGGRQVGGLGLARQLKNEIFDCPPIIVLTGRPQDSWLAAWSQADLAGGVAPAHWCQRRHAQRRSIDADWTTTLATVATQLNRGGLDWMLVGSAASALRVGANSDGHRHRRHQARRRSRAATVLPTPLSVEPCKAGEPLAWLSTVAEPTLHFGDAHER